MTNPIPELIPDSIFIELAKKHFLQETALRDYCMRRDYKAMRKTNCKSAVMDLLQLQYPYLSIDSIRKIVNSELKQ
jgi:hypothetical protein